ncbi:MAG: YhjD/YihY/BrkB family envelope integrity protein, partial [Fibrobacter sp.]|nr:YhjD/YihY/BrkB family envelope integrity protein [Fibrobacter sp.]
MAKNTSDKKSSSRAGTRHKFKKMLWQVKENISNDNVNIISAGISYYSFLAIFPAIAAIIALYGLVADQQTVEMQLGLLAEFLPPQSNELIKQQLDQLVQSSSTALGWSVVFSIIFSIWSANRGMKALFQGINIAYNGENRKGFVRGNGITLLFTFIGILAVILSMALLVVIPVIVGFFDIGGGTKLLINTARWVL